MDRSLTRGIAGVACALMFAAAGPALAQHDHDHDHDHGDAMPPAEAVGAETIRFPTSCHADTDEAFRRGVALMHSFWFAAAIASFEQVLERDPECAIAGWGIALSHWGNPYAGQRNQQQLARGREAVERALATGASSEREARYIEAVAELFSDDRPETQRERTLAYESAMEALVKEHPDDIEARIFYALAISQNYVPGDKTYAKQLEAGAILEPLFEQYPDHPGLAHYIIHAYDHPPLAERALDAALRYASLAPDAPHALHMPSHTFTRIGLWQESIDTNKRSAAVASSAGEELHALDYMAYAYLQLGRDRAAREVLLRAEALIDEVDITAVGATQAGAFSIAAIPARYALERRAFSEAAALTVHPSELPQTQAMTHFARAVGAARSGVPQAAGDDIEQLASLRDELIARSDDYWAEQVDIKWQVARAWLRFAEGHEDEGIALLIDAAEAEDRTDKSAVSPGRLAPARELLGWMLLESDRPEDALEAFRLTMDKEPNRFLGLYGAGRAAEALEDHGAAREYYARLLEVAADADTDRAELRHARRFLPDRTAASPG